MVGKNHPVLRRIRALRRDRRAREAEAVIVAEGIHLAEEALAAGAPIEAAVYSRRLADSPGGPELLRGLERNAAILLETREETLLALQDVRAPQPVVLLVRLETASLDRVVAGRGGIPLLVVADRVQDPGNLGSLLRSADAAGATGFVATGASADLRHPRVVRATMGSIFRLPSAAASGDTARAAVASAGIPILAADPGRGNDHDTHDWTGPVALVLGGEGPGLGADWLRASAGAVRIRMVAGVESLSIPAAGAVLLFEAARQRRRASAG